MKKNVVMQLEEYTIERIDEKNFKWQIKNNKKLSTKMRTYLDVIDYIYNRPERKAGKASN